MLLVTERFVPLGSLVEYQGKRWVFARQTAFSIALTALDSQDWVEVWDSEWLDGSIVPSGQPDLTIDEFVALTELPDELLAEAQQLQEHLNEIATGKRNPLDPTETPRPGYDKGTSLKSRRKLKVDEIKAVHPETEISVRTLERYHTRRHNILALIDRRCVRPRRSGPSVHELVDEGMRSALSSLPQSPTLATRKLILRAKSYVQRIHPDAKVAWPTERTLRKLADYHDPHGLAHRTAKRRQQEANRSDPTLHPLVPLFPGHYVEVDSTKVTIWAYGPTGRIVRYTLTLMIDLYSRSILGYTFSLYGSTAVENVDLLARTLRPWKCHPDTQAAMRLWSSKSLPVDDLLSTNAVDRDALAVPFVWPRHITTDQGSDWVSPVFENALSLFGISHVVAPKGSPTKKPHVERVLHTISTDWAEGIPGYVGTGPEHRGAKEYYASQRLLTIYELCREFEEWWVVKYQNTPHEGLRDLRRPNIMLTPNQKYSEGFQFIGGRPRPISEDLYRSLLPTGEGSLAQGFIKRDYDQYYAEEFKVLRTQPSPEGTTKWRYHYDPIDPTRIFLRDPRSGAFIVAVSRRWSEQARPYHSVRQLPPDQVSTYTESAEEWSLQKTTEMDRRNDDNKRRSKNRVTAERRRHDGLPRSEPPDVEPIPDTTAARHCAPKQSDFNIL